MEQNKEPESKYKEIWDDVVHFYGVFTRNFMNIFDAVSYKKFQLFLSRT